ncbi:MAG: preprotein translocase subunit SecA [Bacillota bacterium]
MLTFLKNFLDDNAKEIKKLSKRVEEINFLEPQIQALSDEALRDKTWEFRERLANGEETDDLLPEAFAVVREASWRVLKMRHFDVQLIGGMVLHQGRIAEMKTGEGKTLVATLPAYLNALTGRGVHIITVNDYLATRDSEWMGQIYRFLGLEVGLIVHGLTFDERKEAYNSDIVYGTNNEFGFDYLRDNMAWSPEQMVQRELFYAIVDEVDSILIDEARTPLIISGQADKPTQVYYTVAKIIPRLKVEADYTVDEKAHTAVLTEEGIAKVEKMLGVENLYDDVNTELSHHVNNALKAHTLMKRDRNYVVKDGEVIIVDEFTGRLMFGRRYSEGLHQAIEAKEGVKIERESQTLATITFQNYFRMYEKLSGMTGTAETEEAEFSKIYGMDVVVIPTNKPMIREDYPDLVYRTEQGKDRAVIEEIVTCYQRQQPVLVGTISIEKSEQLSDLLKKQGVPHRVLNAKYHEQEAEIVAEAGQRGKVTIATNMAGRGTDIVLGDGIVDLGGLHIIGTERHESRRIDNQLRGRSGRQGDPGSSRFYVSLEDDLMRLFGSDNITGLMEKLGMDDSTPVDHPLISRSIETAQKRVENRNFDMRKHVLEYDDVMNQQREIIYRQRRQVLEGENLKDNVLDMVDTIIDGAIDRYSAVSQFPEEWELASFSQYAEQTFLPGKLLAPEDLAKMEKEEIREMCHSLARELYEAKEQEVGQEAMRQLERMVILKVVDAKWMDHIDAMDQLRQGIGLRAYGQRDPLIEYKYESFDMFNAMIAEIQEEVTRYIYRVRIMEEREGPKNLVENKYEEEPEKKPIKKGKTVGRNDPCPCGSGKKYKRCCGSK